MPKHLMEDGSGAIQKMRIGGFFGCLHGAVDAAAIVIPPVVFQPIASGVVKAIANTTGELGVGGTAASMILQHSVDGGATWIPDWTTDPSGPNTAGNLAGLQSTGQIVFLYQGATALSVNPTIPLQFRVLMQPVGGNYTAVVNEGGLLLSEEAALISTAPAGSPVNLRTASAFMGMGKAGISTTGTSSITGNVGVSPAGASSITGFALVLDGSGQFSTSSQVIGQVFAADYAPPTPANMTQAVLDMQAAYTDAQSRIPTSTNFNAGNLGGQTLAPGVYKFTTGVTIPTNLTLDAAGNANAVWIFQISGTLSLSAATSVLLANGAQARNIFWAVAGSTALLATSHLEGTVLDQTSIATSAGATVHGRLQAQTGLTLISTTITPP